MKARQRFGMVLLGSAFTFFIALTNSNAENPLFEMPVNPDEAYLIQKYNVYNSRAKGYHTGIDLYTKGGKPTIYPTTLGVVVLIQPNGPCSDYHGKGGGCEDHGLGNTVIIGHILGNGQPIYSLYAHLDSIDPSLSKGMSVGQSHPIGTMGASGYGLSDYWKNSDGTPAIHLHFEIKDEAVLFNPKGDGTYFGYVPASADNYGYHNPFIFVGKVKVPYGAPEVEPLITALKRGKWKDREKAAIALGQIKDARTVEPLIAALKDKVGPVREAAAIALGQIKDAQAVEPLIAALKDKVAEVRKETVNALGQIKDARAVEPLIVALKDEDRRVRWQAAKAFGQIKDTRAVEPLIAALKDSYEEVHDEAAKALAKIGKPAVEPLIAALKDKDGKVREGAVIALGRIKDIRAVEPLIVALKDKYWKVRNAAAKALGQIKDARVVEPLITALKDEDWKVGKEAAIALGQVKDTRAVEPLIAALKDKYGKVREAAAIALAKIGKPAVEPLIVALKDEDRDVRKRAAWALAKIGKPAVEPLIAALKDEDRDVRERAAKALAKIGKPAVEPLIAALKDKDGKVRKGAVIALGRIKDTRAVEPLIAALNDEKTLLRLEAAWALAKIGKPAVEPLIAALKDKDGKVREGAASALGRIKDTRAVEPLIAALKDEDRDIRRQAASALGEIKDIRAVEPLILVLKDKYPRVRWEAAIELGRIKDTRAVEPLIAALKDEDRGVRMFAVMALGRIKDTRAVQPLTAALKDEDRDVQREAAKALANIGKVPVESLIAALKDKDAEVRNAAAKALGQIKDARVVEPLITALKDEDWKVGKEAAIALGQVKDTRAVEPLIAALKDKYGKVREAAAIALGQIKDTRAVEPLVAALKDKYGTVRGKAAMALGEIKDTRAVEALIAALKDEGGRDKKIKKISEDELKKIKGELNIAEDSRFRSHSNFDLKEVLDKEINSQDAPGLTYGVFILNAIYEEKLIDVCYPNFYDEESSLFLFKLADNLTSWVEKFADKHTKWTMEWTIKRDIIAAYKMHGLKVGTSSLFLAVDLTQIDVDIIKLPEIIHNRALSLYIGARSRGSSHNEAWNIPDIPPPYKNQQTVKFFVSLWDTYGDHILSDSLDNFRRQQREILKVSLLSVLEAQPHPVIASPLRIVPSPPYYEGDKINAEFAIANKGTAPITLSTITLGGRDPDNRVADFRPRHNITLSPNESYKYKGSLTLAKAGNYHFFCAYQTPDGKWNPSVDLGPGLTDEDRVEDIVVKAREEAEKIADDIVITEGLKIAQSPPYRVGKSITAQYTIANKGTAPITLDVLTVGGRDPDDRVADFRPRHNITLSPNESYKYKGSLTLAKAGNYHFFSAYKRWDGKWNTSIDLAPGLTDQDRVEDIRVRPRLRIAWTKSYIGNSWHPPYALATDSKNNIIVAGRSLYVDTYLVIKYDTNGNELWKRLPKKENEVVGSVAIDSNDNIVVAGLSKSGKVIVKYDQSGNELWRKLPKTGTRVAIDHNDNIVVGGSLTYLDEKHYYRHKSVITKYDSSGNKLWEKSDNDNDSVSRIVVDFDNNIIVASRELVKYDSNGNKLWGKPGRFNAVVIDTNNNIIATGDGFFTKKYDPNGNQLWEKRYNSGRSSNGVAIDSDNNIIVVGGVGVIGSNYLIIKYDSNGNQIWNAKNSQGYIAQAVAVDSNNNIIVTGSENMNRGWLTIKYSQKKGRDINLSYNVEQFIPESATGTAFSLPVVKSVEYQAYFPWIASHIDTAWSVILPITFQVTDSGGTPIFGAQIFMGEQKLGLTDNSGKFTYKYVVRVPKRKNKVINLPFSAKKNGLSTSIYVPFSWSVLETTSIHVATKEDYQRYTKVLYQYGFFKSKLPLPKVLTFLTPFLPLLKMAYDLKKGPQIGDRIDILLIEHRILGKNPVAWAYWEQIKRGEEIPHYATGWILSPKDKQRVLDTYFLIKKARRKIRICFKAHELEIFILPPVL